MDFPEFQSALIALKEGQYVLNTTHRLPSHNPLPPTYILVRVSFVALNPCNWKMVDFSPAIGTVGGNDFSGHVMAIGSAVKKWRIGDSVCGFLYGLDPHIEEGEWAGAFAEYVSVPEGLVMRVVESKSSMAEAACLGTGVVTAGMALRDLGISLTEAHLSGMSLSQEDRGSIGDRKANTRTYILIYGGSTATGTMAIQLAKLYDHQIKKGDTENSEKKNANTTYKAGYSPVATCSPGNNSLVEAYGAVKAFDYHSPSCGVAIRAFTRGKLSVIMDCITSTESMKICYAAMSARGGQYVALEPPLTRIQSVRKDVRTGWVIAFTIFGKPVDLKGPFGRGAITGDYEWVVRWYSVAEELVGQGLLKPHPASVQEGGWQGIIEGIERLRYGQVRGKKLVYAVSK